MKIKIGNRIIDDNSPVFIVAELSANHNQNYELAKKTIKAAKAAGADAVKIQTYTADTMTLESGKKYFKINQGTVWDGRTFYDLYKQAYTPWEWHAGLQKYAERLGLAFFSTPFDRSSADYLEKMDVPAYKIASFEITDIPLIEYVAAKGKPVIISTGIAELKDIKDALAACKRSGNGQVAILKCTSAYPAPLEEMNLSTITDMRKRFMVPIGLSDHSSGSLAAIAAVALGAKIIEKHIILDRKYGGPDASFSLEPDEFLTMVGSIRSAEKVLGKVSYKLTKKTKAARRFSRSLFVVKDIRKGEKVTMDNVRSIRPGDGIGPKYFKSLLGKKLSRNVKRGTPLKWNMFK